MEVEEYDFSDGAVVSLQAPDEKRVWRVRELIPYLDYLTMVRYGIIPPMPEFAPTVKMRPLLHKQHPSLSGRLMESIMQMLVQTRCTSKEAFDVVLLSHNMTVPLDIYDDYLKCLLKIEKWLLQLPLTGAIWQPEITMEVDDNLELQGHPDLIVGAHFCDIKTTVNYRTMAVETYLQVLLYHIIGCLSPAVTRPMDAQLAVLLPLSITVLSFTVPVKHLLLRSYIKHVIKSISEPIIIIDFNPFDARTAFSSIGSHVAKHKDLATTLSGWLTNRRVTRVAPAMQMFISGRKSGNLVRLSLQDQAQSRELIQTFKVPLFWHTPYFMNLCKCDDLLLPQGVYIDPHDYSPLSYPYQYISADLKYLISELQMGATVGARGVVIHVGTMAEYYTNGMRAMNNGQVMSPEDIMTVNIRIILPYITGNCQLLLETSAGESNRLYRNPYDLLHLVKRINHPGVALCLDTCHVFSAGGDPLQFLSDAAPWVKLVHYNDAKHGKGCCFDRHAPAGHGHIGPDIMARIALLAHAHNIPCVVE